MPPPVLDPWEKGKKATPSLFVSPSVAVGPFLVPRPLTRLRDPRRPLKVCSAPVRWAPSSTSFSSPNSTPLSPFACSWPYLPTSSSPSTTPSCPWGSSVGKDHNGSMVFPSPDPRAPSMTIVSPNVSPRLSPLCSPATLSPCSSSAFTTSSCRDQPSSSSSSVSSSSISPERPPLHPCPPSGASFPWPPTPPNPNPPPPSVLSFPGRPCLPTPLDLSRCESNFGLWQALQPFILRFPVDHRYKLVQQLFNNRCSVVYVARRFWTSISPSIDPSGSSASSKEPNHNGEFILKRFKRSADQRPEDVCRAFLHEVAMNQWMRSWQIAIPMVEAFVEVHVQGSMDLNIVFERGALDTMDLLIHLHKTRNQRFVDDTLFVAWSRALLGMVNQLVVQDVLALDISAENILIRNAQRLEEIVLCDLADMWPRLEFREHTPWNTKPEYTSSSQREDVQWETLYSYESGRTCEIRCPKRSVFREMFYQVGICMTLWYTGTYPYREPHSVPAFSFQEKGGVASHILRERHRASHTKRLTVLDLQVIEVIETLIRKDIHDVFVLSDFALFRSPS